MYPYRGICIALCFLRIDRWAEVISYVPCSTTGETLIRAELTSIDGAGGTWARAKPLQVWHECPTIAITGVMEYDVDDMDLMEGVGVLEGVAVHEMGHAVGIGYVMYVMLCSSSSNCWIAGANPFDEP